MSRLHVALAACFYPLLLLSALALAQNPASFSTNKISFYQSSAPPLRVQNDIVAVQVLTANDTTVGGEIHYAGLFNIGTAAGLPLLFQFPNSPFSSHVNVRVDGQVYSNDPQRTGARLLTLFSAPVLSDSTLVCVYLAGPIEVRQRLTPKKFSRTTGGIFIEYELVNRDVLNSHQAGVLLEMDTFVNGNDNAQVLTSFGYSRNIQQFDAPALPDFYQAFGGTLEAPGLVAQGTLLGINAVRPDRFVIGDWLQLGRVQWDYTVPNNTPYGDSAVLLRWNEQALSPNQTRRVATYFGVGDVTTQAGDLTLHLTALRNLQVNAGQLSPNPFDVNLLVFNKSGATATAVQATLQLPVGLALVSGESATKLVAPSTLNNQFSGTASWKVIAQCPVADIDLNMSVEVSAAPNLRNTVTRAIFLPSCSATLPNFKITAQPDSTVITAGETASFQINMAAVNGFNHNAQLAFWPPTVGVTGTFTPTTISPNGSASFNVQTNRNLLAGEYPFIITGTGGGLTRSDSVKVRVRAAAPLDLVAPVLLNTFPANGASNVPLDTKISFEVYDPLPSAGLDLNSIRMLVNGNAVSLVRTSTTNGYVLTHTPPTSFRMNETVQVNIAASDLAAPANSSSLVFSFTTARDVTPPFFSNHNPATFSNNVPLRTEVIAEVFDDLAGVDSSSIVMAVRGAVVRPAIARIAKGFRLRYVPGGPFPDNTRVDVVIRAVDSATPANPQSFSRYHFITVRDSLAPVVTELSPAPNATSVAPNFTIGAKLHDDLTGVDSAAVRVFINGKAETAILSRAGKDFRLHVKPASTTQLNDTIRVKLVYADLATRVNRDSLEYRFFIAEDKAAPFVVELNPPRDARQTPLRTRLAATVRDAMAGVDSSSIKILVNTQVVPITITRAEKDFRMQTDFLSFQDDARVEVEIQAQDLAQPVNRMTERYNFTTVRDTLAPLVLDLQPSVDAVNVARDTEIRARLRDDLTGVNMDSIQLFINGIKQQPVLTQDNKDVVLSFKPAVPFLYNAVIAVRLLVIDQARTPNRAEKNFSFATINDKLAPFVTAHSPARFASNVPPLMPITFEVRDAVAGVDSSSLKLRVNNKEVARTVRGTAAAYSVSFTPDAALIGASDTVQVEITAADFSTPPNPMTEHYYYILSRDRIAPFTAGHSPARNSRNADLTSDIALEIRDANPGVDSTSIKMLVNGNNVALHFERRANGFLLRHRPATRWRDNQTIAVKVQARDLAGPPNVMPDDEYSFTTVRDSSAPAMRDFVPRPGEINVASNAVLSFVVEDDLTGVDQTALALRVNGNLVSTRLQAGTNGFVVNYDLAAIALARDTVRIEVVARDLATQPNTKRETYYFVTSQDRMPPYVTDLYPQDNATGVPGNSTISLQLRDDQAGVDSSSVRFFINGERKPVTLSGTTRVLLVTYKPASDFPRGQTVEIGIDASDFAVPTNVMPRRIFRFTTVAPLPDLLVSDLRAMENLHLNRPIKFKTTVRREGVALGESFRIEFSADARVIQDTTIAPNTLATTWEWETSAQFNNSGTHFVAVVVDAGDKIAEVDETNNSKQLVAEIAETFANKLLVQPNPFTPNGDLINDVVEFDFSGLTLNGPSLHIFDVNGIAVYLTDRSSGKRFTWNGRDEHGHEVQPGVYLYTLRDRGANVKSGYVVVAR